MDLPPPLPPINEPRHKPEPARTKSFKLHPVSIVLLAISIIIAGAAKMNTDAPLGAAETVGAIIGAFIFIYMPGWLAWRLSKKRAGAGNLAVCLLSGLFIAGNSLIIFGNWTRSQQIQKADAIYQKAQSFRDSTMEAVRNGENNPREILANMDEITSDIEQYGTETKSETEATTYKVMGKFLRDLQAKLNEFITANERFTEGVYFDAKKYESSEQIAEARSLIPAYEQAAREVATFYTDIPSYLEQRLSLGGLSASQIQSIQQSTMQEMGENRYRLIIQLYRTHTEYAASTDKFLKLLEDNWGKWAYDVESETLLFDDDDTLAIYRQRLDRLIHLEDKAAEITQALSTPGALDSK
ncbi:hypothetical protein [Ruficoccus sp. ZRK36]|uniref:hypothetical protein n=1 Tax=Ruficoccus sp. ZRK36 TaxID=2866311 RepID=UPI001C735D2C|nr:hypothetical protein [Ruficoccus sp. ZRK36]QYY37042.1 hypothetical protein K0V07_06070 [Ruficoccus sp. ZRK36]